MDFYITFITREQVLYWVYKLYVEGKILELLELVLSISNFPFLAKLINKFINLLHFSFLFNLAAQWLS